MSIQSFTSFSPLAAGSGNYENNGGGDSQNKRSFDYAFFLIRRKVNFFATMGDRMGLKWGLLRLKLSQRTKEISSDKDKSNFADALSNNHLRKPP